MAVWTELPPEIQLDIIAKVFEGCKVTHKSFGNGDFNQCFSKRPFSDLIAVSTTGRQFITPGNAVATMLRASTITLTSFHDACKLYAALSSDMRSAVRSVRLEEGFWAGDYSDWGLKELKQYFPRLQTMNLGSWTPYNADDIYDPEAGEINLEAQYEVPPDELDLKLSFHSKLAMYFYHVDRRVQHKSLPATHDLPEGSWPSCNEEEAFAQLDMEEEMETGKFLEADAKTILSRYWNDQEQLTRSAKWRIALMLEAKSYGVNAVMDIETGIEIVDQPMKIPRWHILDVCFAILALCETR